MGASNSRPCGLQIKLEKDILWAPHRGDDYILGYFDRISFQSAKNWLDFSPRTSAVRFDGKELKKKDLDYYPLSSYPIKLLFPASRVVERLRDAGLDYQSWMGNIRKFLDDNRCVTVALVNLTDEFKGNAARDVCEKQLERLVQVIRDGSYLVDGKQGEETQPFDRTVAERAHLCILPSLGYSDYCILMAEQDWSFAPVLIEYLHRASYEGKPVLSTDYVMPIYHIAPNGPSPHGPIHSSGHKRGIRLSMRVHLKPGAPMGELQRQAGPSVDVWQLSGSSDCMLVSKPGEDFSGLLRMVMSDHKSGKKEIKNLVISTEATLQRTVNYTDATERWPKFSAPYPKNQRIENLRTALRCYWRLLDESNGHMRLFSAIWDRVTAIENICRQPHNRTLQKVMDQWLIAFTDCLNRGIRAIEQQKEALANVSPADESYPKRVADLKLQWERMEEALEIFVSQVGSFLADLSRSDCFSMEIERYNHASVSSATALLMAYNRWQNKFVESVLAEESNKSSRYAFLVRSGGCDRTHTNNIFAGLEPGVKKINWGKQNKHEDLVENMPLITHMSEMALFDCGGAILRMTHECMHFCGERLRTKRIHYIFAFVARYFGQILTHAIFPQSTYCDILITRLQSEFQLEAAALAEELQACWYDKAHELCTCITSEIQQFLTHSYEKEKGEWDERDYMSDNLAQWMLEELSLYLLWYRGPEDAAQCRYTYNDLANALYQNQLKTVSGFYSGCNAIIQKYDSALSFCAVERRRLDGYLAQFERDGSYLDQSLKHIIMLVLDQLLGNPSCQPTEKSHFLKLGSYNLSRILEEVILGHFSETFADIEACMRLNASLSDYLFAFVFEEWDLERSLTLDTLHIFRIPAVLRVCFPETLCSDQSALTDKARAELKHAVDNLVKHQMPETRLKYVDVADRVDALLREYCDCCWWIAEPLEDYLRLCRADYENKAPHNGMKIYQKAFQRLRLLEGDVDSDGVIQMFTNLITIGEVDGIGEDG